jgi:hypothetical protein
LAIYQQKLEIFPLKEEVFHPETVKMPGQKSGKINIHSGKAQIISTATEGQRAIYAAWEVVFVKQLYHYTVTFL